jgi:hypothetical protein
MRDDMMAGMQNFEGIAEKLKRAKENIVNLHYEIEGFFNESDYPAIPQDDRETLLKAIEYHKNRIVPPRFSVLAGEAIHHLRSCFDHVVWHFSTGPKQNDTPVDFPVCSKRPVKPKEISRFDGKIQRITNSAVRDLIERLQPYNAAHPLDDPLFIIHDFDIVDKHKELLLCFSAGSIMFPIAMTTTIESYQKAHPEMDPANVASHFQSNGVLQPCIAFRNFGQRKIEPTIPGLTGLFNYTVSAIKGFESV